MKSILRLLTAVLPLCMICLSCSDDEPFSTVGPDDDPHILSPMFPDRQNGELPVIAAISRDANFKMTLTVTPADYTDVVWYIDGDKAAEGDSIDIGLPAGLYTMKVVATTVKGKSTSREGLIRVNPLDGDPWSAEKGYERFVAPGTVAVLYGDNLEQVRSVRIGNSTPSPAAYSTEGGTPHLTYTVPTDVEDGTHRVFLTDTDGEEFGANTVTVSKNSPRHIGSRTRAGRRGVDSDRNKSRQDSVVESRRCGDKAIHPSDIRHDKDDFPHTCRRRIHSYRNHERRRQGEVLSRQVGC